MTDRTDEPIDGPESPGQDIDPVLDQGSAGNDASDALVPDVDVRPVDPPPVDVDERPATDSLETPDVIVLPPTADEGSPALPDETIDPLTTGQTPVSEDDESVPVYERAAPPPVAEPSDYEGWSGEPVTETPGEGDNRRGDEPVLTPPITTLPDDTPGPAHDVPDDTTPQSTTGDDTAGAAAGGFLGGIIGRFKRGSGNDEESPPGPEPTPAPGQQSAPWSERITSTLRSYLDPRQHGFSTEPHRRVMAAAVVITLISLLANSGGMALIVLSAMVPILILITLTQHDVFEKESNLIIAAVAAAGAVAGILLSGLASWIQGEQWFDTGKLNFAAGGFSGQFGESAGNAPVVVWLLCGVLFPLIGIIAIGGTPAAMQRFPQFRNEAMDAVILGGATAAGYSIGMSIVYWWPMVGDPGPSTSVQDWTLRIIGVTILRAIVLTLSGALIGFGVWRYLSKQSTLDVGFPAAGGLLGFMFLHFGSIALQPSGSWAEFLCTLVILVLVFAVYRSSLNQAIAVDREALGDAGSRIVCPACHRVTPAGLYCAHCGQQLSGMENIAREVSNLD
ncbi:MAG TPA: hypothetical protein VD767_04015 [Thermomicrobiales bacterium]|nr:hypothetical protein [Thermomicrobiales bacterium]